MSPRRSDPTDEIRDELFSHIRRCGVLEASKRDQDLWFNDTMDYLAGRYPDLSEQEIGLVRAMGERYVKPVIPHGAETHAANRDEWQSPADGSDPAAMGEVLTGIS